jgi:hypothetical protein
MLLRPAQRMLSRNTQTGVIQLLHHPATVHRWNLHAIKMALGPGHMLAGRAAGSTVGVDGVDCMLLSASLHLCYVGGLMMNNKVYAGVSGCRVSLLLCMHEGVHVSLH